MEKKEIFLGVSSKLMSNTPQPLQVSFDKFFREFENEGIQIISLDNIDKKNNSLIYGIIKEGDESLPTDLSPIIPQLASDQFLRPQSLDHFLTQFFALIDFQQQVMTKLTKGALVKFHSRYKYLLMAYSQTTYRELGRYMANIPNEPIFTQFTLDYRDKLFQALSYEPTREGHTNALMHMAGYFKRGLNSEQKQQLSQAILQYRQGNIAFSEPFNLLQRGLSLCPDEYLAEQRYFSPYPSCFDELRTQF
ncbi:YbgA family protein [Proteus myxofaciens]|uniref:DUF1722 domain-containing protein n=1 Tax=Proteus myxofaciens ATCC 19692 TaxID=1354337 RepID=A0A198FHG8_9GAMM|nr:DUF1722 domain-containing protein [Proteus myxofaciens]OAT24333.1 hypothetical protein M983_2565 [Proteus myxofaciens ATCC 19692]